MSWNHVATLSLPSAIKSLTSSKNSWILRGRDYVAEIDSSHFTWKWMKEFEYDYPFGDKNIFLFDQVVIFVRNRDSDDVWLQGFTRESGELLWEQKINWDGFENYGGVLLSDKWLLAIEYKGGLQLIIINPLSGQIITQIKAVPVEDAGRTMNYPQSSAIVSNHAYYYKRSEALYCFSLDSLEEGFKKVRSGNVMGLEPQGTNLYCRISDFTVPEIAVFWLDGATAKQKAKLTLPAVPMRMIAPTSSEADGHLLLLFDRKRGMGWADFHQAKLRWHVGEKEKWEMFFAVLTPTGIIAKIRTEPIGFQLVSVDYATGCLKDPPRPSGSLGGLLHWTGQYLLVGTSDGLEVFRPQSDEFDALGSPLMVPFASPKAPRKPEDEESSFDIQQEMSQIDHDFTEVVHLFLDAAQASEQQPDQFGAKAHKFNQRLNRFFSDYPDESLASIAMGFTQLDLSYEDAMADLLKMRGSGKGQSSSGSEPKGKEQKPKGKKQKAKGKRRRAKGKKRKAKR